MSSTKPRSDFLGAAMGFVTFALGIALLLFTFKLAFDMFSVRPEVAIGATKATGVDVARVGESVASLVVRFLLLLVMAIVGSTVANRGIKLYVSARALPTIRSEHERAEPPEKVVTHTASSG